MLKVRNNNSLRGFTLAEVLITLGIIGVVAAITIPLLIQNSNSKKFITQFKKSLSTLNQAAINAQAQYDMDYSLLGTLNQDSACATDALSKGQDTLCGLLNNTLSGHTYQGKYGVVKGADSSTPYQADVSSFAITDFLIFSFADGAFVAFNPNAVNCSLASGSVISTEMVTSGNLANCLGFIDVNGSQFPNKEIKCSEGDTELSVNSTCKVTNRSMGDIFPIVFHDGIVEPITNAALSAFLNGYGKGNGNKSDDSANNSGNSSNKNVKIGDDGREYEYDPELDKYVIKDENGNVVGEIREDGKAYLKGVDGQWYEATKTINGKTYLFTNFEYRGYAHYYPRYAIINPDGTIETSEGRTLVKGLDNEWHDTTLTVNGKTYPFTNYEYKGYGHYNPRYAISNPDGTIETSEGRTLIKGRDNEWHDTTVTANGKTYPFVNYAYKLNGGNSYLRYAISNPDGTIETPEGNTYALGQDNEWHKIN